MRIKSVSQSVSQSGYQKSEVVHIMVCDAELSEAWQDMSSAGSTLTKDSGADSYLDMSVVSDEIVDSYPIQRSTSATDREATGVVQRNCRTSVYFNTSI